MYKKFSFGRRPLLSDIKIGDVPLAKLRQLTSIAAIDDQPFAIGDSLKKSGYNVKELGDIEDIQLVASYDVVLCDIKGVGRAFGATYGGGHIIEEVRRFFPDKYLIAYTAHSFDATFNRFFKQSDVSIKKDAGIEEWLEKLDKAAKTLLDPRERWLRVRSALVRSGMDLEDIATLEVDYIKAVQKKSPEALQGALEKFTKRSQQNNELVVNAVGKGLGAFLGKVFVGTVSA